MVVGRPRGVENEQDWWRLRNDCAPESFHGRFTVRHILAFGLATSLIAATVMVSISRAADEKPKYTIKEVMAAHKKGDLKKVLGGNASQAEKDKLVDMYKAMHAAEPPKGDKADWKKATKTALDAAEEVAAGKDGSLERLDKATKCGGCHKAHKPS
jgi:hypothetical protein